GLRDKMRLNRSILRDRRDQHGHAVVQRLGDGVRASVSHHDGRALEKRDLGHLRSHDHFSWKERTDLVGAPARRDHDLNVEVCGGFGKCPVQVDAVVYPAAGSDVYERSSRIKLVPWEWGLRRSREEQEG